MSMVSISSRPSDASRRVCSCDVVPLRSVATTRQPRLRYSPARAKPRPRDAPMRRSVLSDDRDGIYDLRQCGERGAWTLSALGDESTYSKMRFNALLA